jgi:hypothetical protein
MEVSRSHDISSRNDLKVAPPSHEITLWQRERSYGAINQPEPLSVRHSLIRQSEIADVVSLTPIIASRIAARSPWHDGVPCGLTN